MSGRFILSGVDWRTLDGPEWLDTLWVMLLDQLAGQASRAEVAAEWDKHWRWGSQYRPDFESWGATPEAVASGAEVEAFFGVDG